MSAAPADTLQRALITPEGVDLRVRLGSAAERGGALLIDLMIMALILVSMTFLVVGVFMALRDPRTGEFVSIIWLLGFFVLRNFYFATFECSPRAATPGKRVMGLRVASRDGSALKVDQVIARNAMRELELFLPTGFMLAQGQDAGALVILCGIVWCGVFVFFPLFNRDKLRLGDLIAGTWVLKAPKHVLLPDMADTASTGLQPFSFTDAQLSVYGVKELQVLEGVLRDAEPEAITAVAERIRIKTGIRKATRELDSEFLHAYYGALRRRLERKILFGVRKQDKHDKS